MADHPPPPPLFDHRNATEILHQTTVVIVHHLRTFLILSFFLLSLNNTVENITHFLTTYIDNNPVIESLLSTTGGGGSGSHRYRRHRPNNQEILDGGFLSGEEKPKSNSTSLILDSFNPQFGFSNFVSDNGIKASEIVRSGVGFSFRSMKIVEKEQNVMMNSSSSNDGIKSESKLFVIGVLFASYGFVFLASVVIQTWTHGVAFVLVVNNFLNNNHISLEETFHNGAILGSRRLFGFIMMRFAVRTILSQVLGIYYFGNIKDHYSFFKFFFRSWFLPFSGSVKSFEQGIYMVLWYLLDMCMSIGFGLGAWVAMVDPERTEEEVVEEGYRLFSLRIQLACLLKSLEGVFCGEFGRLIVTHLLGKLCASMIQSFLEVYFMVALMLHYFSVKSMDDEANGIPFGEEELEDMLDV